MGLDYTYRNLYNGQTVTNGPIAMFSFAACRENGTYQFYRFYDGHDTNGEEKWIEYLPIHDNNLRYFPLPMIFHKGLHLYAPSDLSYVTVCFSKNMEWVEKYIMGG